MTDSLLPAPVCNFITQPCENEIQCIESLAEFLRGNRTELYFASRGGHKLHVPTSAGKIELSAIFIKSATIFSTCKSAAQNAQLIFFNF